MANKVGRMSKDERAFVAASAGKLSIFEIAAKLGRTPEAVRVVMGQLGVEGEHTPGDEKAEIRAELKRSEKWKRLRQELASDELEYFEEEYVKLMAQFRHDVLPSEETQIFDAIKFDLLKSRNLVERRLAREEIARVELEQREFLKKNPDVAKMGDEKRAILLTMQTRLNHARAAETARTNEYVKLQERQDALMKSLKSTRDQRVRDAQSGQETVLTLLKALQRDEFRRQEGRQMELVRMAADAEYARLGQLHEYEDGQADRPILSADTVNA